MSWNIQVWDLGRQGSVQKSPEEVCKDSSSRGHNPWTFVAGHLEIIGFLSYWNVSFTENMKHIDFYNFY